MKRDFLDSQLAEFDACPLQLQKCEKLPAPQALRATLPLPAIHAQQIAQARQVIVQILAKRDPRLLLIVGPCSVHDTAATLDYAHRLRKLAAEVGESFQIVMRVYLEKPRSCTGWKGLLNDPALDGSCDMAAGLQQARALLLQIAALGMPIAVEALDPLVPHYLADLVSWFAIGARTTESQSHREMASSLGAPVGLKNASDGSFDAAINAILAAQQPHTMLGIHVEGQVAVLQSRGNPHGHLVLRGGKAGPNYSAAHIQQAQQQMLAAGLAANIMVDCSHANSGKDHQQQVQVMQQVVQQILAREAGEVADVQQAEPVMGLMLESFIVEGKQAMPKPVSNQQLHITDAHTSQDGLRYGCSITDPCLDWDTTASLIRQASVDLQQKSRRFASEGQGHG